MPEESFQSGVDTIIAIQSDQEQHGHIPIETLVNRAFLERQVEFQPGAVFVANETLSAVLERLIKNQQYLRISSGTKLIFHSIDLKILPPSRGQAFPVVNIKLHFRTEHGQKFWISPLNLGKVSLVKPITETKISQDVKSEEVIPEEKIPEPPKNITPDFELPRFYTPVLIFFGDNAEIVRSVSLVLYDHRASEKILDIDFHRIVPLQRYVSGAIAVNREELSQFGIPNSPIYADLPAHTLVDAGAIVMDSSLQPNSEIYVLTRHMEDRNGRLETIRFLLIPIDNFLDGLRSPEIRGEKYHVEITPTLTRAFSVLEDYQVKEFISVTEYHLLTYVLFGEEYEQFTEQNIKGILCMDPDALLVKPFHLKNINRMTYNFQKYDHIIPIGFLIKDQPSNSERVFVLLQCITKTSTNVLIDSLFLLPLDEFERHFRTI